MQSRQWFYLGVVKTYFKGKFQNHNNDFSHRQDIKNTELSKYILSLRDAGIPHNIKWSTMGNVKVSTKNYCSLYLTEKYHLLEYFEDI